ncbi:MAG: NAD+ synthase [Desulfobacteraceae bacterium]|nr:MAG: NAD+ synthase [Desulfobacteraceae bacterium]
MKIAIIQLNPLIGNFKRQFERIVKACERAKIQGCDLAVCPELALCGYPPRDLLDRKDFVDANRSCLEKLMHAVQGIGVVCGLVDTNPDETGNFLFNSAVLFENGRILHQVNKQLLPTYDVFDERRHFEPGRPSRPLAYKGLRLGLTICEDAWNDKDIFKRRRYALDPVTQLIGDGIDFLINISASPFHQGKRAFRDGMLAGLARKHKMTLVFVNQVGGNDHILFDGASAVFNARGEVVAQCRDFDEDEIVFDTASGMGDVHAVSQGDTQSVLQALIMGTRDYVTKCGYHQAVVGLSGGVDSALTIYIAVQALGSENVAAVFMPSRHTSRDNHEDTRLLAQNLGVAYNVIPIDSIYNDFVRLLLPAANPSEVSLTEQNIQARARGTLLMGISNRDGCLVLSTGNKSELAVGYCTLYGDMNGGLAVISDVYKTQVYEIGRLINSAGEVIPRRILEKAPSAELKPNQTDQDDLPPYEVVDGILKGYIEEGLSPDELIAGGRDRRSVEDVLSRVDKSEYKRQQAPPGLKVTSKAFGEGRRYPVAKRFRPV